MNFLNKMMTILVMIILIFVVVPAIFALGGLIAPFLIVFFLLKWRSFFADFKEELEKLND